MFGSEEIISNWGELVRKAFWGKQYLSYEGLKYLSFERFVKVKRKI